MLFTSTLHRDVACSAGMIVSAKILRGVIIQRQQSTDYINSIITNYRGPRFLGIWLSFYKHTVEVELYVQ
jgi:hypothetical protein